MATITHKYYLDIVWAASDGIDLPKGGLFRSERCNIVGKQGSKIMVTLPNSLDPETIYFVENKHIITTVHVED